MRTIAIRPLRAALYGVLAVLIGVGGLLPSPSLAAPSPPADATTYTFAFHDAEVAQVTAEILGKALGLSYTIAPGVAGKMSFQIDRRLTGVQLLQAFEAALETNDVVLVRDGDALVVQPRARARGTGTLRVLGDGARGAGYETLAVPLTYAAASELAKALKSIGSDDIVVYVDDRLGLLVLGGTGSELQAAVEMVRIFDRSGLEDSKIRFFELQQAAASVVGSDLTRVLEASGVAGVTIIPLRRLNGLFVLAQSTVSLDEVSRWVARLDAPSKERTASLWVYHPRNLAADALASTLADVLGASTGFTPSLPSAPVSAASGAGSSGGPAAAQRANTVRTSPTPETADDSDQIRIGVDKQSNTLIFSTSAGRWVQIQRTLDELDRTPNQILIEASILEVTLGDEFNYGVDWSLIGSSGRLITSSINNSAGVIGAIVPGASVTFLDNDIKAAVNALSGRTTVEVVSAPKIIALDNHLAKLEVGDQVPISTQSAQSINGSDAPLVSSIEYRSTGVILNVTPRIGGDGRIRLDIAQEVSSVALNKTSGIDSPTIAQRKLSTTLVLDNGGVVALGGLISTGRNVGEGGVPFLKDIKIAGNLFKSRTRKAVRTELIVLISAKVIADGQGARKAMDDLLADMTEIRKRGLVP